MLALNNENWKVLQNKGNYAQKYHTHTVKRKDPEKNLCIFSIGRGLLGNLFDGQKI